MDILRFFSRNHSSSRAIQPVDGLHKFAGHDNNKNNNNNQAHCADDFGSEWVEVDEPIGLLMPQMKRRRHLLRLDQVHHVLHYANYRHVMRIQDVALVTPVEEIDARGQFQWWMSIQDTTTMQVWIVHFASLERLQSWLELLRVVVASSKSHAHIGRLVLADASCMHKIRSSCSPITKETILEMSPEN